MLKHHYYSQRKEMHLKNYTVENILPPTHAQFTQMRQQHQAFEKRK